MLKLFRSWVPADHVEVERRLTTAAFAHNLPVPWVGDIVEIEGRLGLEYELIEGPTMTDVLQRRPWRVRALARTLANLHKEIHRVESPEGLPLQRDRLGAAIRRAPSLAPTVKRALERQLASLPTSACLCHGDFHPGNVVLARRGPVIIDWIDASIGSPLADVGRTLLLLEGETARLTVGSLPKIILLKLFIPAYRNRYFDEDAHDALELDNWRPVLAAARLAEGIDELNPWLKRVARDGIERERSH